MRPRARRHPLLVALVLSALLHILGIATLPVSEGRAVIPPQDAPLEVALLERQPPVVKPAEQRQQIVAPPDEINDIPPERTRFESDHDNVVLRETVHKGVPHPAPPAPPKRADPAKRAEPKPPQQAVERADDEAADKAEAEARSGHAPALEDLFASTDELVRAQQGRVAHEEEQRQAERAGKGPRRLALAVAPAAPEWALPGTRGTLDSLPDIQRGDVTLLNTKANVFAPFVRRIGERVFQHLIIRQRRLVIEQILSAHDVVRMHVTLDPRGRLKSVTVEGQSGSATMDETLSDALNTGAFDNNPPPSAANAAGEYEFEFQAQLRAFLPGPGGSPTRIESRLSVALL
jgi:TonB C terminal